MGFWHYIGEFFLFRWILGSRRHNDARHDSDTYIGSGNNDILDSDWYPDSASRHGSRHNRADNRNHGYSAGSYDDFDDEQDDYDTMDDDF